MALPTLMGAPMKVAGIALITSVLIGLAISAPAQSNKQDWLRCADHSPDIRIAACSAFISGKETQARLATAFAYRASAYGQKNQYGEALKDSNESIRMNPDSTYAFTTRGTVYLLMHQYDRSIQDLNQAILLNPNEIYAVLNRGIAYRGQGQYDRSMRDFNQVIRLKPKFANVYYNRGIAYANQGQYDNAIQDFSWAIRLKPNFANAFRDRGIAKFHQAHFEGAAADFQDSLKFDSSDVYTALWLHLARKNAGQDDAQSFAQQVVQIDPSKWPAPVANLFLGKLTEEGTLAAASNPDPLKAREQSCEAEFFIGEYLLLRAEKSKALSHFQTARDTCPHYYLEWNSAAAEMTRLDARTNSGNQ